MVNPANNVSSGSYILMSVCSGLSHEITLILNLGGKVRKGWVGSSLAATRHCACVTNSVNAPTIYLAVTDTIVSHGHL